MKISYKEKEKDINRQVEKQLRTPKTSIGVDLSKKNMSETSVMELHNHPLNQKSK